MPFLISVKADGNGLLNSLGAAFDTRWLLLDGCFVLELPNDDYKSYKLSNGTHTLQVVDDSASGEESNICSFEIEEGKGCWITAEYIVEKNDSLSLVTSVSPYDIE